MTTDPADAHSRPTKHPGRSLWPREHGAYAQLGFPVLAALLLGAGTAAAALLTVATLAAFVLHEPVLVLLGLRGTRARRQDGPRARTWLLGLGVVSSATGVMGLWLAPPAARSWALVPAALGAALGVMLLRRQEKTTRGELLAALALTSPALPIGLANALELRVALANAAVWGAVAVLGTVAVRAVTARVKARARGAGVIRATALAAGLATAIGVATAAAVGALSGWLAAALVPAALFAFGVALRLPHPRRLRQLGFALLAVQTWVLVALLAALG